LKIFCKKKGVFKIEISFLNNIKKYNSISDKTSIGNVMNEAFREAEHYKNNVNENLTELNKILIRRMDVLKRQYEDTEVNKNAKDVISVVSNVQVGDFEGKYNADLTYFLKLEEWEKYYKENINFLKEKLGKNAECVYAVIHFDESTPHLHTMWTFSQENKQENIEINYEKIKNALKTDFSRKNAKLGDKALKSKTDEYKEAFQKFCEENRQKKIETQIKNSKNKNSEKKYKFETGTSPFSRFFFKEINGNFKERMEYNKQMLKLQKRLEVFSNEKAEFVVTRSKKVNSSEDLDIRKRDLENEIENAEFNLSLTKDNSERSVLRKYVALLTKSELVEDKKTISKDDFLKRFEEYATEVKEMRGNFINRTFSKVKELVNVKRKLEEAKQDRNIKNKYKKTISKELENINEALKNIDFNEIEKKIKKYETSEKIEATEKRKEKIYDEIRNASEHLKEVRENIEEIYDKRSELYYEISELETKIESRKKEAERVYIPSAERIRQLEKEAIEKAEAKAKIEIDKIKKEIEKKNAEFENLEKIRKEREKIQNQEFENYKIFKEKKEKEIKEWQAKTIDERVKEYIKTTPISSDEIDDYIEKNQEKFQDLIEKRQEKIENEIEDEMKKDMREDTKQAFSVFQDIIREYAKKIVYKDLINFQEAKRLTVQAFAEIKVTSENFFIDFVKNLRNKVNELIATKRQNGEKGQILNEKHSRQQNIR
jgi:plasmid recombination enzyme